MNFVFDIGNVLIDFKPDIFLKKIFNEQSLSNKMLETIFNSPEWIKLDLGIINHLEACDIFYMREPSLKPEIKFTMERLTEMLTPISETIELLPKIKRLDHKLYYLSNYHKELSEYILVTYDFFNLFDGGVFSCDIRSNKPSPKIFRYFLEKYLIFPKDCLFFDDDEANIMAAKKEGINSILFTGAECVKPYLYN